MIIFLFQELEAKLEEARNQAELQASLAMGTQSDVSYHVSNYLINQHCIRF